MEKHFNIWESETFHAKELAKWNTPKRQGGYGANGFEEFPKMLYMARKHPITGKFVVAIDTDELSLDRTRILLDAQAFTKTCQFEVKGPEEESKAIRNGWRRSMAEAMAEHEDVVLTAATAAAHQNYLDRNMSEGAKAEKDRFEASTPEHVSDIPEAPKRRGWPKGKPRAKKIADLTQS